MPNAEAILETIEKKRIESTKTTFSAEDVEKLRGTFNVEYTVSKQLSKNFGNY